MLAAVKLAFKVSLCLVHDLGLVSLPKLSKQRANQAGQPLID
jgi:hypothetical protein